jgi:hypothetical protein
VPQFTSGNVLGIQINKTHSSGMLPYGFPHSGSSPSTQEHSFSTM